MSREPTLLEDLREAEADALVRGHTSLALRLRAHAARLREEMAKAEDKALLPWSEGRTKALLERVNGGPVGR